MQPKTPQKKMAADCDVMKTKPFGLSKLECKKFITNTDAGKTTAAFETKAQMGYFNKPTMMQLVSCFVCLVSFPFGTTLLQTEIMPFFLKTNTTSTLNDYTN